MTGQEMTARLGLTFFFGVVLAEVARLLINVVSRTI
jgi:hypothetical protein